MTGASPDNKAEAKAIDLPSLFHDLERIPQDDGPNPVCAIDYKPAFVECMDYLRAVIAADELSERSLKLTTVCLRHNPANYTTWHFRRRCLAALSTAAEESESGAEKNKKKFDPSRVRDDLELASDLGGSNPKNYQIWYHRRALLEPTLLPPQGSDSNSTEEGEEVGAGDAMMDEAAREELEYVARVLDDDAKNYHAWSHRQWIVRSVDSDALWDEEVQFAHGLILEDIRNNSAWNHRWFALHRGTNLPLPIESAREEGTYAMECAMTDPFNESPWRYLVGIIHEQIRAAERETCAGGDVISLINEFEEMVSKLGDALNDSDDPRVAGGCPSLMSAHIDLLEAKGDSGSLAKAAEMSNALAYEYDTIRLKYWLYREKTLRSKAEPVVAT